MSCGRPGCVLWQCHDPPCIDGQCNEMVDQPSAAAPAGIGAPVAMRSAGQTEGAMVEGVGNSSWEVLTDHGWSVWMPGVHFQGEPDEEIAFTLRPREGHPGFPMKAWFDSPNSGIQKNLQTGRERPLRLAPPQNAPRLQSPSLLKDFDMNVKRKATGRERPLRLVPPQNAPRLQSPSLPKDFDMNVKRKASLADFQEPIGSDGTILTYLLRTECIVFVSGKWLVQKAKIAERLPRRQNLPVEAFIPVKELFESKRGPRYNRGDKAVLIVALSYGWCRQGHPDPDCFHLQAVGHLLGMLLQDYGDWFIDVAIFWDWFSLFQIFGVDGQIDGRTPEEQRRFSAALDFMHVIYGHKNILAWRLESLPEGVVPQTLDRGWPCFEEAVFSTAEKSEISFFSDGIELEKLEPVLVLSDNDALLAQTYMKGFEKLGGRQLMPRAPAMFRSILATKVFTGKGDLNKVGQLFTEIFEECFAKMPSFRWLEREEEWNLEQTRDLALVFSEFTNVKRLRMDGCRIRDFKIFFEHLSSCSLEELSLRDVKIGGEVRHLFSSALPRLPQLQKLDLCNTSACCLQAAGVDVLSASLKELILRENKLQPIDLEVLPRLSALNKLDLGPRYDSQDFAHTRFCHKTNATFTSVRKVLARCPHLRWVRYDGHGYVMHPDPVIDISQDI